jgi:hypothetical protein
MQTEFISAENRSSGGFLSTDAKASGFIHGGKFLKELLASHLGRRSMKLMEKRTVTANKMGLC